MRALALLLWLLCSPAWAQGSLTLMGAGGAGKYNVNAVDYNGSTDYLSRASDFAGNVDSSKGIFSAWVRLDGGDGTSLFLLTNSGTYVRITRSSGNKFAFLLRDITTAITYIYNTNNSYVAGATWLNILSSWDTSVGGTTLTATLYINNVSDITGIVGAVPFTIEYTNAPWGVGATETGGAGTFFNGCISELYFAPGQYLDFSVAANRAKFITSLGKPVSLGLDGSTPTGTAPLVYLKSPVATVGTNSGTGGAMTVNGTPAACSSTPSG